MKKWIIGISLILFVASFSFAQQNSKAQMLSVRLERIFADTQTKELKPYYANTTVASTCEAWRSCSVWAFNQYIKDPHFKIIKAQIKTQRKVYRHRIAQETSLFVEATFNKRPLYVEFTTPHITERGQTHNYISKFPQ